MEYIIGIDIGTSATKAVASYADGSIIVSVAESYPSLHPEPGRHELDPELLFNAVIAALEQIRGKMDPGASLSGVAFSCAMHGLMAVNEKGEPLTKMITWADTRSKDIASNLKNSDAGADIYKHTGTPVHPMSPLNKILWLKAYDTAVYKAAAKFIGIKEYIWWRIFGAYEIDHSVASATGLFDIRSFDWYRPSLELCGINTEKLSEPVTPTYIRRFSRQQCILLPDFDDVPFIIGASDGCLASLGSNAHHEGDASLTIGTSAALRLTSSGPQYDPQQRIFSYILAGRLYVSGGAINNGGVVVRWFIDRFKSALSIEKEYTLADAIAGAATLAPGSNGLIFLPYLFGERAPIWDANARGVFFGVSPEHTALHFLRAVVEGICFSLYQVADSLEQIAGTVKTIFASGGFIESKEWLQILTDIFNRKVIVQNHADASAMGAARLGFVALNTSSLFADDWQQGKSDAEIYLPDAKRHEIYMANYKIFVSLYEKLKDDFTAMAELRDKSSD